MQLIKIFATALLLLNASIYSLTVTNTHGDTVPLSNFQHKSMLIVNIATGNAARVEQLAGLQQIQQEYADSLIVLAFPSNSFGNENRDNAEIQQFCQQNYGATFLVAAKGSVDSTGIQPLYNWLTKKSENGVMDTRVKSDYQKFLIDPHGNLAGVFAGSVLPTDSLFREAVTASFE